MMLAGVMPPMKPPGDVTVSMSPVLDDGGCWESHVSVLSLLAERDQGPVWVNGVQWLKEVPLSRSPRIAWWRA
jgi:hypothetical protein